MKQNCVELYFSNDELFGPDGCLTDAGLAALAAGRLDALGRLEVAEHLAYCDRCVERYAALLGPDALETPPQSVASPVLKSLWVSLMTSTLGRAAVAAAAAALAFGLWQSGLSQVVQPGYQLPTPAPAPRTDYVEKMWDACDDFMGRLQRGELEFTWNQTSEEE